MDKDKDIFIFDVDGTLANILHRRHLVREKPKNWPKFFEEAVNDTPNRHVTLMAQLIARQPVYLYIVSGRPENNRQLTVDWLHKHEIHYNALYMRPDKDNRADDIIKKEIYDKYFLPVHDRIMCVFDDRPRVIRMWRSLGIPVFDCGDGVEF